jgi:hypothetical protein
MNIIDVVNCVTRDDVEIKFKLVDVWKGQDDSSAFIRKVVEHIKTLILERAPFEIIYARTIASELRIGFKFTKLAFEFLGNQRENILLRTGGSNASVRYYSLDDIKRVRQAIYDERDGSEGACVSTIAEKLSLDMKYLEFILTSMSDNMEIFFVNDLNYVNFWRS